MMPPLPDAGRVTPAGAIIPSRKRRPMLPRYSPEAYRRTGTPPRRLRQRHPVGPILAGPDPDGGPDPMGESLPLSGPIDLEALDRFLMSDASPEDCMQLSDLDGFLTGIAIGPEPILPSEWLT